MMLYPRHLRTLITGTGAILPLILQKNTAENIIIVLLAFGVTTAILQALQKPTTFGVIFYHSGSIEGRTILK
jgi:enterochelin esterase-like enzyme